MATARGKRTPIEVPPKVTYAKPSKASHALATINAEDAALARKLRLYLGRSRYRRACLGERVPRESLRGIETITGGRVKETWWEIPAEGPAPYPYCARFAS